MTREYYLIHRKEILKRMKKKSRLNRMTKKAYMKKYYQKCRKMFLKHNKKYYKLNRIKILLFQKKKRNRTMKTWLGLIPSKTKCEICGKTIYFNKNNIKKAIHFDHRNNYSIIKEQPTVWLQRHKRTLENEKIWKECNFGMLCISCNGYLPTKNRELFAKNLINYLKENKWEDIKRLK